jgi:rhodanese-related sulfurtransferase
VTFNPPKSNQFLAPVTENNLTRFTNMSKMSGASILTLKTGNKEKKVEISPFTDFLLLDLRSEPEYLAYHIKDSINYPALNIGRDRWSDCIVRFKNKPEKFIVVYMESEKSGIPYANELYQKGFENVYLLTGGIYEFVLKHYEYVEGDRIPMVILLFGKNRKLNRCRLSGITVLIIARRALSINIYSRPRVNTQRPRSNAPEFCPRCTGEAWPSQKFCPPAIS